MADAFDRRYRAALVVTGTKGRLHRTTGGLPFRLVDLCTDAAISDDLDTAVDQLHINQDTAIMFGVPDAQPREHFNSALACRNIMQQIVQRQAGFDGEAQLTTVQPFRSGNRGLNRQQRIAWKGAACQPWRRNQMLE